MVPVLQAETQGRERESKDDRYRPEMLRPACQDEHQAREGDQGQAKDIPWPSRRAGLGHLVPSAVVSLALIGHSNLRRSLRSSSSACRWVSLLQPVTLTRDDHQAVYGLVGVPRGFRTVHPIGWTVWKGEVIASTEEE